MMEQYEKARIHIADIKKLNPHYSLESERKANFFKDPSHFEILIDALSKAGLN
jgi:hypothetical protein